MAACWPLLLGLVFMVDARWIPTPVVPLYAESHAPGAKDPATELWRDASTETKGALMAEMKAQGEGEVSAQTYMDVSQAMPANDAFDAAAEPAALTLPPSGLNEAEKEQLEYRLTALATAVNSAGIAQNHSTLGRAMLTHVVAMTISLPRCDSDTANQCIGALGRTIAAIAGVSDEDVIIKPAPASAVDVDANHARRTTATAVTMLEAKQEDIGTPSGEDDAAEDATDAEQATPAAPVPMSSFSMVVMPSSNYEYEGSALAIAHRISMALRSGSLARNLHLNGQDIKLNEIQVHEWPVLDRVQHWINSFEATIPSSSGVDISTLDMSDLSSKVAGILGLSQYRVTAASSPTSSGGGGTIRIQIYVINSTHINTTVEDIVGTQDTTACGYWLSKFTEAPSTCTPYVVQLDADTEDSPVSPNVGMSAGAPCFGHGQLQDNMTCTCDEDWKDLDCSKKRCPVGWLDKAGYLPQLECSGQGACVDNPDTSTSCACETGYASSDCSTVLKCSPGEEVQCSGHGGCTPDDAYPHLVYTCKCFTGFHGDNCQHGQEPSSPAAPKCPKGVGKLNGKWAIWSCTGRGTCECDDVSCVCNCHAGWNGTTCSQKVCVDDCNNHGECFDGECACDVGWSGHACEVQHGCVDDESCHFRGNCVGGQCQCRDFFAGRQCETDNCEVPSVGQIGVRRVVAITVTTGPHDQLACELDGKKDAQVIVKPGLVSETHHCLAPGKHTIALSADSPTSRARSSHFNIIYGVPGNLPSKPGGLESNRTKAYHHRMNLILNRTTFMPPATKRDFTVHADCPGSNPCSGNGECVAGRCCCAVGWKGDTCDTAVPATLSHMYRPVNSSANTTNTTCAAGHMVEEGSGRCVCTRDMAVHANFSTICTKAACPTAAGPTCGVCSGHGDCYNGTCTCDVSVEYASSPDGSPSVPIAVKGWYGPACHDPIHCPLNCMASKGQGACNYTLGSCVCNKGFAGQGCATIQCPGKDGQCSGNGVCQADGVCLCKARFEGPGCEDRVCVGGCMSGQCVAGTCVCKAGWTGSHCELPPTCLGGMLFSNCSTGCVRTCNNPSVCADIASTSCTASCECPPNAPLWDEGTQACATAKSCPGKCWGHLEPDKYGVALSISDHDRDANHPEKDGVIYVCRTPFKLCYKTGMGLLDPSDNKGILAQARSYEAPIGFMMYDNAGVPIRAPWGRINLEKGGKPTNVHGADFGSAWVSIAKFGRVDIKFYTMARSSTSPVILSSISVFASDCTAGPHTGSAESKPAVRSPRMCPPAPAPENGRVQCDGRGMGSSCVITCNDGFVPSHPTRLTSVCGSDFKWSLGHKAPATTCIAAADAFRCAGRAGQICTAASNAADAPQGVCVDGTCSARPASSFCELPPSDMGKACIPDKCKYTNCNGAMTACPLVCTHEHGATSSYLATCEHGPMGGWWAVPDCQ